MSRQNKPWEGRELYPEPDDLTRLTRLTPRSRRQFLKTSLATAAASQFPGWANELYGADLTGVLDGRPPRILYDGRGEFAWVVRLHAKMLANLLGRFIPPDAGNVRVRRVERYRSGRIERHPITFYLGNTFGNPLPQAFKDDVMSTNKPVVWFKYNIEQIAWTNDRGDWNPAFLERLGFAFKGNSLGPYTTVHYRGETFFKFQDASDSDGEAVSEIGVTEALAFPASVKATISSGAIETGVPSVICGRNLWYVADLPFSFISEEDRYLVFADLLFDMLGADCKPDKRALVRLDDVHALSNPDELRAAAEYLSKEGVPFSVSVIPFYRDPNGVFAAGSRQNILLLRRPEVLRALRDMVSMGGEIVMHGLTHQYRNRANPYNAVSACHYEFFRVTRNDDASLNFVGPVSQDSTLWATARVRVGKLFLRWVGLEPFAFEAPHNAASRRDYRVFAREFDLTYHRVLYFTSGSPLRFAGQFFPYPIVRDGYRQRIIPENLGGINPAPWPDPELGPERARLPLDILQAAKKNCVLRDAWASFFANPSDLDLLKETVAGIKALGFRFVRASQVL